MLKKPKKTRLKKPPLKLEETTGQGDEAVKAQLPLRPLATRVASPSTERSQACNTAPAR